MIFFPFSFSTLFSAFFFSVALSSLEGGKRVIFLCVKTLDFIRILPQVPEVELALRVKAARTYCSSSKQDLKVYIIFRVVLHGVLYKWCFQVFSEKLKPLSLTFFISAD